MDKQAVIAEFQSFAHCDEATADFFLSSCNYDLQTALNHFCEGRMDQLADAAFPGGTPPDPPKPNHSPLASRGAGPTLTHLPEVSAPTSSPKKSHTGYLKAEASKPSDSKPLSVDDKNRKFVTMSQYRQASSPATGRKDDEEGQTFYAGGAEGGGGELLVGPRRPGPATDHQPLTRDHLSNSLFRAGRDLAERERDRTEAETHGHPTSSSVAFTGAGNRLGSTTDVQPPPGAAAASAGRQPGILKALIPPGAAPLKHIVLKLWRDGLSLDDGPLRQYQDPKNRELVDYVTRGEIPPELRVGISSAAELDLKLEDHRDEDYMPPKKTMTAFAGSGHVLGNENPAHPSEFSAPLPPAPAAAVAGAPASSSSAPTTQTVDLPGLNASAPVTHLQIRLSDGERINLRVNLSSTVGQIRQYLAIHEAGCGRVGRPIHLRTSYPSRPLDDDSVSVEGGKLQNASLLLK